MRYIFIVTRFETEEGAPDVADVAVLATSKDVAEHLRGFDSKYVETTDTTYEWALYEIVNGQAQRRAVVFDRANPGDVQIQ